MKRNIRTIIVLHEIPNHNITIAPHTFIPSGLVGGSSTWRFQRTPWSCKLEFAQEFTRIACDLFPTEVHVNLISSFEPKRRILSFNPDDMCFKKYNEALEAGFLSNPSSSVLPSLTESFSHAIQIIGENEPFPTDNTSDHNREVQGRIIIISTTAENLKGKPASSTEAMLRDGDHKNVDIPKLAMDMMESHNSKAQSGNSHEKAMKIGQLEICILALLDESPIMNSVEKKVIYHNSPTHLPGGEKLDVAKNVVNQHSLKVDFAFVRPSFMKSVAQDLVFSFYQIFQLNIKSHPSSVDNKSNNSSNKLDATFLIPNDFLFHSAVHHDKSFMRSDQKAIQHLTRSHIGQHLGSGFWIPAFSTTLFLKPWDRRHTISSLISFGSSPICLESMGCTSSQSLLSSVLDGQALCLSSLSTSPSPITHLLIAEFDRVQIKFLQNYDNVSLLAIPKHLYGTEQDIKSCNCFDLRNLIEANTFVANIHPTFDHQIYQNNYSVDCNTTTNGRGWLIERNMTAFETSTSMESTTRALPLTEDQSILFTSKPSEHFKNFVIPIRDVLSRSFIGRQDLIEIISKIHKLADDKELQLWSGIPKNAHIKRKEAFNQLWIELKSLSESQSAASPNHSQIAQEIASIYSRLQIPSSESISKFQQLLTNNSLALNDKAHLPVKKDSDTMDIAPQPSKVPKTTHMNEDARQDLVDLPDRSWSGELLTQYVATLKSNTKPHSRNTLQDLFTPT